MSGRLLKNMGKPSSKASYFMHTYHVQGTGRWQECSPRGKLVEKGWLVHACCESGLADG